MDANDRRASLCRRQRERQSRLIDDELRGYSTDLQALVEQPSGINGWNGPYLKKKKVPNEPWGNPYHYRSPGEQNVYDLYSYGSDNMEGGEGNDADVVSW